MNRPAVRERQRRRLTFQGETRQEREKERASERADEDEGEAKEETRRKNAEGGGQGGQGGEGPKLLGTACCVRRRRSDFVHLAFREQLMQTLFALSRSLESRKI